MRKVIILFLLMAISQISIAQIGCSNIVESDSSFGTPTEIFAQRNNIAVGNGSINFIGYKFVWINCLTAFLEDNNWSFLDAGKEGGVLVMKYIPKVAFGSTAEIHICYTLDNSERFKTLFITGDWNMLCKLYLHFWNTKISNRNTKLVTQHFMNEVITFQTIGKNNAKIKITKL